EHESLTEETEEKGLRFDSPTDIEIQLPFFIVLQAKDLKTKLGDGVIRSFSGGSVAEDIDNINKLVNQFIDQLTFLFFFCRDCSCIFLYCLLYSTSSMY
ncbi:hypothetical protein PMAYCL1PPCAC_00559, partial [Pristionchus mayeri]